MHILCTTASSGLDVDQLVVEVDLLVESNGGVGVGSVELKAGVCKNRLEDVELYVLAGTVGESACLHARGPQSLEVQTERHESVVRRGRVLKVFGGQDVAVAIGEHGGLGADVDDGVASVCLAIDVGASHHEAEDSGEGEDPEEAEAGDGPPLVSDGSVAFVEEVHDFVGWYHAIFRRHC